MKALLAALAISMAAPLIGCQSEGTVSETPDRAMAKLSDAARTEVNGYLGAMRGLVSELGKVTDSSSAAAEVAKLDEYIAKVNQHRSDINALPPEIRRRVSEAYGAQFASQNDAFAAQVNRIKGTPGLGMKLGAALDKVTLLR